MSQGKTHSLPALAAAWSVHLFTASGAVAGLLAWLAIADQDYRGAFAWMGLTVFIDSADGALARWCRVKERIPHFDGALLDNVVDYFTYALLPAFFICRSTLVPEHGRIAAASVIVLASAYQFCRADAKTEDHFFTGFPSYWNVVVLYQFLLWPAWPWLNLGILLVCAALTFQPGRYVYPSRTPFARKWTIGLGGCWAVLILYALWSYPSGHFYPALGSLVYILYYAALSLFLSHSRI